MLNKLSGQTEPRDIVVVDFGWRTIEPIISRLPAIGAQNMITGSSPMNAQGNVTRTTWDFN